MDWLVAILPIASVLICPLVMIFMTRGMHGGQGGRSAGQVDPSDERIAELVQHVRELRNERDQVPEKVA